LMLSIMFIRRRPSAAPSSLSAAEEARLTKLMSND